MRFYIFAIFIVLFLLTLSASLLLADLNKDLIAYWPMDDGSGDIARDVTGNGHNGKLLNGPKWEVARAKVGKACLNFDGEDDLVEIEAFDVKAGGITIAAWINPDDFDINDARIVSKAKEWGADDHWWMLSTVDPGRVLRFRLKTNDGQSVPTLIATSGGLVAGTWAHAAATWDGKTMRLYKDGQEVGNMAKGGTEVAVDNKVKVAIGSQPSNAFATDPSHIKKNFDGLIDDVIIYGRALGPDEIKQLSAGIVPSAVTASGKLINTWSQVKQK